MRQIWVHSYHPQTFHVSTDILQEVYLVYNVLSICCQLAIYNGNNKIIQKQICFSTGK